MYNLISKKIKESLPYLVIAVCLLLAYSNTFYSPFIFDDPIILDRINHAYPGHSWDYITAGNRFLFNISMLLNYVFSARNVFSYHFVNFMFHTGAVWALFLLLKELFSTTNLFQTKKENSLTALFTAMLWGLHPLQTESVSYISQRAEVMIGFFTFSALYCLFKGSSSDTDKKTILWYISSLFFCLNGMISKEAMVGSIAIIPLFDYFCLSHSVKKTLKKRKYYYLLLFVFPFIGGVILKPHIISEALSADSYISPWIYFMTQCKSIIHYIYLSFIPIGQSFDYGAGFITNFSDALPYFLPLLFIFIGVIILLIKKPSIGFWGMFFFVTLAPRSSFIARPDAIVEHRMYIPLAGIVVLFVYALKFFLDKTGIIKRPFHFLSIMLLFLSIILGVTTFMRNKVYSSAFNLWFDTVQKNPENPRAQNYLGIEYNKKQLNEKAEKCFRTALKLYPQYAIAYNNLGNMLAMNGKLDDAIAVYKMALKYRLKKKGDDIAIQFYQNLAKTYFKQQKYTESEKYYKMVFLEYPKSPEVNYYLGVLALIKGDRINAAKFFHTASKYNTKFDLDDKIAAMMEAQKTEGENFSIPSAKALPDKSDANLYHSASEAVAAKKFPKALKLLKKIPESSKLYPIALNDQGVIYTRKKNYKQAEIFYRKAIKLKPDYAAAYFNLGVLLGRQKRYAEAVELLETAHNLLPKENKITLFLKKYKNNLK